MHQLHLGLSGLEVSPHEFVTIALAVTMSKAETPDEPIIDDLHQPDRLHVFFGQLGEGYIIYMKQELNAFELW